MFSIYLKHGRVKVRTTAEQEKIKQAEKQKKAAEFKKGIELVFQKVILIIWILSFFMHYCIKYTLIFVCYLLLEKK